MKIKTDIVLVDPHGKNYTRKGEVEGEREDLLLKHVIVETVALVKSKDPFKSFSLTKKFAEKQEVDLKSEDITFLKEQLVNGPFVPFVLGQAICLIEGNADSEE